MAAASGMSLGRTMGEWLGDTKEAADAMAEMLEQARSAPKQAMREIHSYALGLTDVTSDLLDRMKAQGRQPEVLARDAPKAGDASPPRPVIRGGKSHQGKAGPRGKKP